MPNYCKECCEKYHIKYDPTGKTCYSGMTCDGCKKQLYWYEEEVKKTDKYEKGRVSN